MQRAFRANARGAFLNIRPLRRRLAGMAALALVLAATWACAPSDDATPPDGTPVAVATPIETPPTAETEPSASPTVEASPAAAAEAMPATPTPTVAAPTATPTPAITQRPTPRPAPELAALVADLGPKVAAWRGLEAWDVPAAVMTSEEFAVWLAAEFEEEYPADEAAIDQLEWELLGLIRPDQNLYELQLALYSEQVAGFYDPEAEQMVVIGDHDLEAPFLLVTLAHEYVHALQDRAFDLDALEDSVEDNQDALLALRALVEGDATLAGLQYAERARRQGEFARPSPAEQRPDDALTQAPQALQAILIFPYVDGLAYVAALLRGGWPAVDAAYARLPASTEQVLHPAKYAADEAPLEVDLPSMIGQLPPGWSEVRRDVFGEFMVSLFFAGGNIPALAAKAAAGWGGDAYALYRNEQGHGLLTMKFRWDSKRDLDEFWEALVAHFLADGLGPGSAGEYDTTAQWLGDGRAAHAERSEDSVVLIIGHTTILVRLAAAVLAPG